MEFDFPTTAGALSQIFDATLIGSEDTVINGLAPLPKASEGTLSYCASRKYGGLLNQLTGAIVITRKELVRPELPLTYLVVEDPQSAFAEIAKKFSTKSPWKGVSPQAIIHPTAVVDPSAAVAPFCVVSERAVIGAGHGFISLRIRRCGRRDRPELPNLSARGSPRKSKSGKPG